MLFTTIRITNYTMKLVTKLKLAAVHNLCDAQDKSTEFMIQYMQDVCKVPFDAVINYLALPSGELEHLRTTVNDFTNFMADWME